MYDTRCKWNPRQNLQTFFGNIKLKCIMRLLAAMIIELAQIFNKRTLKGCEELWMTSVPVLQNNFLWVQQEQSRNLTELVCFSCCMKANKTFHSVYFYVHWLAINSLEALLFLRYLGQMEVYHKVQKVTWNSS